ncbi:TIGR01777 family oxidoreductase [Curtobacterium ammoniigenes]|uniref:TIGR01777 family oxidoreductase n=1 Tax=Curtobacterium ammoniigenes TaxID=395387 RepID=UPI000836D1C6|nr:TIGR01777 family oxidoreductase [Curtobacterium ammoniigenes]
MADSLSIVIAGASGFIGTPLVRALRDRGHTVTTLTRRDPRSPHEFRWAPGSRPLDPTIVSGADVVINLAGASIAKLPWTAETKRAIRTSRIDATRTLVQAMHEADTAPAAFLSGSASGYYGDRPADQLDDDASAGTGFLADVCVEWEAAAASAPERTRIVLLRTGLVLGAGGGAAAPLLPLTRFGLGGRLGPGGQYWPWIALDDEVGAIVHLAEHDVSGPVNLAGPELAISDRITRRVAEDMHRPYLFSIPGGALRLVLGEAADELLLSSQGMVPTRLLESGYAFAHPTVESAVDAIFD